RAEPEQREPEQARGDPPRAPALAPLEQVAEDGDERGGEGGVGDERAHRVREEERELEGVHRALHAEGVLRDDLAHEPEHAREPRREREDRGRPREPASAPGGGDDRSGGGVRGLACAGRLHHPDDTRRRGGAPERAAGLWYHPGRPRSAGVFRAMANIRQQKKRIRIAAAERLENLRYRSTVKTLTRRLAAAVEGGDAEAVEAEHRNLVRWLDRAVARGALHRNTAARKKSQAARLASGGS